MGPISTVQITEGKKPFMFLWNQEMKEKKPFLPVKVFPSFIFLKPSFFSDEKRDPVPREGKKAFFCPIWSCHPHHGLPEKKKKPGRRKFVVENWAII